MEHEKIYSKARDKYGKEKQSIVAIEELNECGAALCRFLNSKCDLRELQEELADAEIMLEQMRLYYNEDGGIDTWKKFKLSRLARAVDPGTFQT